MKAFFLLAHPEEQSFNASLHRAAVAKAENLGWEVKTSDLYRMNFNPVSDRRNFKTIKDPDYYKQQIEELFATEENGFADDIETEIQKLEWCDLFVLQFPLWWFGLPAILKGWMDRVLAYGRTYGQERFYENGVFKGKRALCSLTTGGPEDVYQPGGWNGDIHAIIRPIQRGMLRFVGFDVLAPHIAYGPAHIEDKERQALIDAYGARLANCEKEAPIDVGSY